jgi:hypothetical protein
MGSVAVAAAWTLEVCVGTNHSGVLGLAADVPSGSV